MNDPVRRKHSKFTYHILCSLIQNPDENLEGHSLMTIGDVREKFLENEFSLDAVKEGIKLVAKDGFLSVYYRTRCENCGEFAYMYEDNFAEKETITEHQNGEVWTKCAHCDSEVFGFESNKFEVAVPQKYLENIDTMSESTHGILQTIREWLKGVFS